MIESMAQLDLMELASHYATVLMRTVGLFVFVPIFGSKILPMRIRVVLAMVLAFVFAPLAPPLQEIPTDAGTWLVVALRELAAGFGLGIAAKVVFAGIETAAALVSGQSGFSLASMVDPASGDQAIAPALMLNLLAIALLLSANLHHMFIVAVHKSFELLPPAATLPDVGALDRVAALLGARMFTVAVELAAPALIVTVLVDLVMVLVGKSMPQVPILLVAYPFKLAAGVIALGLLIIATGSGVGWIGRTMASDGAAILNAFSGN